MAVEIDPHELITSVQARKLLYDRNDKLYGNRNFTNQAWRDVAEEIGTDDMSARRKWTALRDYFTRQYKLVHAGSTHARRKVRWCFYNNLLFLQDYLDPKHASCTPTPATARLDYDPACVEDMESSCMVDADHVIKSHNSSDEDDSTATPLETLDGNSPTQTSLYRHRNPNSNSNPRRTGRKRNYATAHGNNESCSSNSNNNCDDDAISGHSIHFDSTTNIDGHHHVSSSMHQASSSSFLDSPLTLEEDHDELFLKSLLPDLKCVSDEISKMECKIQIQGVILKFIRMSRSLNGNDGNGTNSGSGNHGAVHVNTNNDTGVDSAGV